MKIINDITDYIGKTPILRLNSLCDAASVFVKCEFLNPFSAKDRAIVHIIKEAEKAGTLKKKSTIVESTSGNTGIAIAYISAIRGYRALIIMPETKSYERFKIMKASGAEIILTKASDGVYGAKKKAEEIVAKNPNYFHINQHFNPNNKNAHYLTTGPEIYADTNGNIDVLVAGIGTGGTLCGTGRYLKEKNKNIRIVAVEPAKSPYISKGVFAQHGIIGLAPSFTPSNVDKDLIDVYENVTEDEAYNMCRTLAKNEGILVGISSGAVGCVLERMAACEENRGCSIVGVFVDSGQRYLSFEDLY